MDHHLLNSVFSHQLIFVRIEEKKQAREARTKALENNNNNNNGEEPELKAKTKTKTVKKTDREGFTTVDTQFTKLDETGNVTQKITASAKKKEEEKLVKAAKKKQTYVGDPFDCSSINCLKC